MTDDPSVAALLITISTHDQAEFTGSSVHGPAIDEPVRFRRTLIVETTDSPVGVGKIWEYWLHLPGGV